MATGNEYYEEDRNAYVDHQESDKWLNSHNNQFIYGDAGRGR